MAIPPDSPSEQGLNHRAPGSEPQGSEFQGSSLQEPESLLDPGDLLDQVLEPLLADFEETFTRGSLLLDHCPDRVLSPHGVTALRDRLSEAKAALAAARALRAAAPTTIALDMATITPWHELVVEVWSLSAAMRNAGVEIP